MRTFLVDERAKADPPDGPLWRQERYTIEDSIARIANGGKPEAVGASLPNLVPVHSNAFVEALTQSYAQHYPLVLGPDEVWMTLAQSFAQHVDQNAEKLRRLFVQHEGKEKIVWRNDSLVMGSPNNPWMDGFDYFADEIKKHIGKKHDLLTASFSTTGPVERAASQVVLMDAMKHYFEYGVMTLCGVPEITLLGTTEDWKSIRARVQAFNEVEGLSAWVKRLDPITSQFVEASEGRVDRKFWADIYKTEHRGSGGPEISGWANALFLYLANRDGTMRKNPLAEDAGSDYNPRSGDYPCGISKVPFWWEYHGPRYDYEFLGGFVAVSQDPETLAVRPALGWAVRAAAPADALPADEP